MKSIDLRTKSTNPNSDEINKLMIERLTKNAEIQSLKTRLIIAESQLAEIEQTLEYVGGQCQVCGEYGDVFFDADGFCQFCI